MEWNEMRIAELARMWRDGFSASQVARQLGGITRSAVIGKIHRLGISHRPRPSRPRATGGYPAGAVRARAGGRRRTSAPPAARPAPVPPSETATATVLTLTETSCRWPIGDPGHAAFGFCGRLRAGKGPYCQGHGSMASRNGKAGMNHREIDHIVQRYAEGAAPSLETSSEMARAASLAVAR